ncbi:MAG: prephenate dehydrogenase/arogenate dehydrogenase family protein [Smithella sp.]|nr:prephenate dehydrogenase/arogenate dehydrogenase family protein [Smithella sp.]
MKNIKVGIIGGTNGMGKWFARLLRKEGYTIHVCGRKTKLQINDLARLCNVIVVSVPISATATIIKEVGPLLTKDQLLMDLTSLKKEPVKLMLANTQAEVIGCHPLFGPQLKDVSKQNVILCPARGKKWLGWLKSVLKKNKMSISETTPDRHDKMMAIVQVLNHLNTITLGMALAETKIPLTEMNKYSTPFFRIKLDIIKKVFTESPEMYLDIIMGNPETEIVLDLYQKAMIDIHRKIKFGSRAKSQETVLKTARKLYRKDQ